MMVADDDPVVREIVGAYIESNEAFVLVGTAEDADSAIAVAARERPAAALVDVEMPGGGGETAVRGILAQSPETAVVALSAHDEYNTVVGMVQAGAMTYVVKGCPAEEVATAIKRSVEAHALLD